MSKRHSESDSSGSCLGCLVTLLLIFLIFFVINHWDQLDARLAHMLGLS